MRTTRIPAFKSVVSPWFTDIAEGECNPGYNNQPQYNQQHRLWLRGYQNEYICLGTDRCTVAHHFCSAARFYMNLFLTKQPCSGVKQDTAGAKTPDGGGYRHTTHIGLLLTATDAFKAYNNSRIGYCCKRVIG